MDLGSSFSPWLVPCDANQLQTFGAYALFRHPVYIGLIVGSAGLSLLTKSFYRLLWTMGLYIMLSNTAIREEAWLQRKHGQAHTNYTVSVPRYIPKKDKVKQIVAIELLPQVARAVDDVLSRMHMIQERANETGREEKYLGA
eukprot:gnl/TRDRNA2_/TRDRNA2_82769_c1_seq2.p2 gnl/TRDRNA2_/TRDRNA2_82769_c1~~gnl/TRDRNA2_/TRDRNA2_82769_c1_seq2.p2  ORF type:complete len:142 (+),score=13.43 gnl/TRDRNA2_/TRDRNA2_82769_c1_seq2:626-1051(+)